MSEEEKRPQPPKQSPRPTPIEQPDQFEKTGLPPVDQTPPMPPVKPPKKE